MKCRNILALFIGGLLLLPIASMNNAWAEGETKTAAVPAPANGSIDARTLVNPYNASVAVQNLNPGKIPTVAVSKETAKTDVGTKSGTTAKKADATGTKSGTTAKKADVTGTKSTGTKSASGGGASIMTLASGSGDIFGKLSTKAAVIGSGLQTAGFLIAGLGLIVFSFMAIFNKVSWKNLAYIMMSCFILSFMVLVISFVREKGDQKLKISFGGEQTAAATEVKGGSTPNVKK